jgi:hypothetical protein
MRWLFVLVLVLLLASVLSLIWIDDTRRGRDGALPDQQVPPATDQTLIPPAPQQ